MYNSQKIHGINIGYEEIPIDEKIIKMMTNFGYNEVKTKKYLLFNIKNEFSATYYLFMKKNFKYGAASHADICSNNFNSALLKKKIRERKYRSVDFTAIVENSARKHNQTEKRS